MTWKMSLFSNRFHVVILIAFIAQNSAGVTNAEILKRQNLIPSARIGREIFFTDGDIPTEMHPTLEESIDISSSDSDYIDSEVFLSAESDDEDIEDDVSREPTVQRKKRSISEVQSPDDKPDNPQDIKSKWNKEAKSDFFQAEKRKPSRNKLIFIPRIGKKSYSDESSYANKRVVFIPRIGKKSFNDVDFPEEKRAIFIPRIGKRSSSNLYNPDMKRAVFIPRIGRGAVLLPKVKPNPQYRVSGRIVFIPRIG